MRPKTYYNYQGPYMKCKDVTSFGELHSPEGLGNPQGLRVLGLGFRVRGLGFRV